MQSNTFKVAVMILNVYVSIISTSNDFSNSTLATGLTNQAYIRMVEDILRECNQTDSSPTENSDSLMDQSMSSDIDSTGSSRIDDTGLFVVQNILSGLDPIGPSRIDYADPIVVQNILRDIDPTGPSRIYDTDLTVDQQQSHQHPLVNNPHLPEAANVDFTTDNLATTLENWDDQTTTQPQITFVDDLSPQYTPKHVDNVDEIYQRPLNTPVLSVEDDPEISYRPRPAEALPVECFNYAMFPDLINDQDNDMHVDQNDVELSETFESLIQRPWPTVGNHPVYTVPANVPNPAHPGDIRLTGMIIDLLENGVPINFASRRCFGEGEDSLNIIYGEVCEDPDYHTKISNLKLLKKVKKLFGWNRDNDAMTKQLKLEVSASKGADGRTRLSAISYLNVLTAYVATLFRANNEDPTIPTAYAWASLCKHFLCGDRETKLQTIRQEPLITYFYLAASSWTWWKVDDLVTLGNRVRTGIEGAQTTAVATTSHDEDDIPSLDGIKAYFASGDETTFERTIRNMCILARSPEFRKRIIDDVKCLFPHNEREKRLLHFKNLLDAFTSDRFTNILSEMIGTLETTDVTGCNLPGVTNALPLTPLREINTLLCQAMTRILNTTVDTPSGNRNPRLVKSVPANFIKGISKSVLRNTNAIKAQAVSLCKALDVLDVSPEERLTLEFMIANTNYAIIRVVENALLLIEGMGNTPPSQSLVEKFRCVFTNMAFTIFNGSQVAQMINGLIPA